MWYPCRVQRPTNDVDVRRREGCEPEPAQRWDVKCINAREEQVWGQQVAQNAACSCHKALQLKFSILQVHGHSAKRRPHTGPPLQCVMPVHAVPPGLVAGEAPLPPDVPPAHHSAQLWRMLCRALRAAALQCCAAVLALLKRCHALQRPRYPAPPRTRARRAVLASPRALHAPSLQQHAAMCESIEARHCAAL